MRKAKGYVLSEFNAAIIVFIAFLVLPILHLVLLPVRYAVAAALVREVTHRVALAEKRSNALNLLDQEWHEKVAQGLGINVRCAEVSLHCRQNDVVHVVCNHDVLPDSVLDNRTGACEIEVVVQAELAPVFPGGNIGLPGITAPLPIVLSERACWEHMDRDPQTGKYFINE